uniref:Proteasome subunit beta type-3 n=1 Tax=Cacopsylla melanoneura TaxID=428564 RepID=A0A8D8PY72_9HEMI
MNHFGGAFVAMAGDRCFAIGVDHLLVEGDFTIAEYEKKVHQITPHLFIMNPGRFSESIQFSELMSYHNRKYETAEKKPMSPEVFASIASWELYSRKLRSPVSINPIIVGFYPDTHDVFLSTLDIAGCETRKKDFVTGGSAQNMLMGIAESFWKPNMTPEGLFEVCCQVVIQACERDTKSGWGATVIIVEPSKVTTRKIATRMD